uniref:Putative granulin n=1 Tax=Latrodectus hesperus TaxID=256737 RepID=E7D1P8_LATHE|nr:putative granulin [Latrodectus hesperus]
MNLFLASLLFAAVSTAFGTCPPDFCTDDQTCCDGPSQGSYGCCLFPNAVCCSDGLHCCPQNMICNLAEQRCEQNNSTLGRIIINKKPDPPAVKAEAAVLQAANRVDVIYCPGGYYYCQDGATCCPMVTGQYSCCPYPSAMCCADMVHCCPYGTHCDPTSRYCLRGHGGYHALFRKPAFPMK